MQPYLFKPLRFYLPDGKPGHAVDIWYWCPKCGMTQVYGVAISPKHFWRICEKTSNFFAKGIIQDTREDLSFVPGETDPHVEQELQRMGPRAGMGSDLPGMPAPQPGQE